MEEHRQQHATRHVVEGERRREGRKEEGCLSSRRHFATVTTTKREREEKERKGEEGGDGWDVCMYVRGLEAEKRSKELKRTP